jgi:hypothetical protein
VPENKHNKTENAQQKKRIEYFRRFFGAVIAKLAKCFVPVVKRQQRLDNSGNPEKSNESGNKHKHFPFTDVGARQVAFRKHNAYDEENNRLHQMKHLQA